MEIRKRSGDSVMFDRKKVLHAIMYASMSQGMAMELDEVGKATMEVTRRCYEEQVEDTAQIQQIIEDVLEETNKTVKKSYVLYKKMIDDERKREWKLTQAGESILHNKYLKEGENQHAMFKRISLGSKRIEFLLRNKAFLPGGRILAGIGEDGNVTTSNCYFIPIENDSVKGIMTAALNTAETYKTGGGVGITLESLRPKGSAVNNSAKTSTGSVSFAPIFDTVTGTIGQKGRRGALMLSHHVTHPDIEDFISMKANVNDITNANISVKVTNNFMDRAINKRDYYRVWKDDKEYLLSEHDAHSTLEFIAKEAHASGEPGLLYWDNIEQNNYISYAYSDYFKGVNPCGELPLNNYGACLLSAINLSEFVINPYTEEADIDFEMFIQTIHDAIRYMNKVLDLGADKHALDAQKQNALNFRPLGLGIMGLHDLLLKMNIEYGSEEAISLANKFGFLMLNESVRVSSALAEKEGAFPMYKPVIAESPWLKERLEEDVLDSVKKYGLRNAQLLTIAPTGSTSTMLDVSGGIEPFFATSYQRTVESFGDEEVKFSIMKTSVREYLNAHPEVKEEDIVTAQTLDYTKRIKMQGAFQHWIDNAISSTINLPEDATVEDVLDIYKLGYEHNLKGLTVFRDNCGRSQILNTTDKKDENVCPKCGGKIVKSNGCENCEECGFGLCSI